MLPIHRLVLTAGIALALTCAASAQEGARSQAAQPPPSPQLEAVTDIADALGMIRGVQREWKSVNRVYFVASGTLTSPDKTASKLSRGFIEMSFAQHALRKDMTLQRGRAAPARTIEVAREDVAWNETEPGLGATAAPGQAKARVWEIYTTPHGAVRAAMEALVKDPAAVKLVTTGGTKTFDFISPAGPLRITSDASNRPSRTELTIQHPQLGQARVVTEYSDYRDWEKLGVWFPTRIRQTINGSPSADLTVSEYRTNPYVIFPYPPGMAPAGASNKAD